MTRKKGWQNVLIIVFSFLGFRWIVQILQRLALIPRLSIENYIAYQTILEILVLLWLIGVNHWWIHQKVSYLKQIENPITSLLPIVFLLLILMSFLSIRDKTLIPRTYPETLPLALFAGITEEYLCRSLLFPQVLSAVKSPNTTLTCGGVYKAVFGSAFIFGCFHLFNLIAQDLMTTLMQVWLAFIAGVFLVSLYIASNSIFVPMIFHFLYDFIIMFGKGPIQQPVRLTLQSLESLAIFTFFYLGYSLILINKKRLVKQLAWLKRICNF